MIPLINIKASGKGRSPSSWKLSKVPNLRTKNAILMKFTWCIEILLKIRWELKGERGGTKKRYEKMFCIYQNLVLNITLKDLENAIKTLIVLLKSIICSLEIYILDLGGGGGGGVGYILHVAWEGRFYPQRRTWTQLVYNKSISRIKFSFINPRPRTVF